jgi:preprotein translocase subunit SecA
MIRVDHPGPFYGTVADKLVGLVEQVVRRHESGQPVLIGSASIEQSETVSGMLTERGIPHNVLTAKNNDREAEVIAGAARLGAVTVIARMAGRGVDIVLGGPDGTAEDREDIANRGGLCVLGAERFGNRRLEMHLRGRAGRQGDPGESELFASCEDDAVIRLLGTAGAARNGKLLTGKGGVRSRTVTRGFDARQARLAALDAEQVREELEFDAVLSDQQREIYAEREGVLTGANLSGRMKELTARQAVSIIAEAGNAVSEADVRRCKEALLRLYPTGLSTSEIARAVAMRAKDRGLELTRYIDADVGRAYALREAEIDSPNMRDLERRVCLSVIDRHWREHLGEMTALRAGIGLRALGGRSPLAEYRRDADALMRKMRQDIDWECIQALFYLKLRVEPAKGKRKA